MFPPSVKSKEFSLSNNILREIDFDYFSNFKKANLTDFFPFPYLSYHSNLGLASLGFE